MWQVGKYKIEPLRFMLIIAVLIEVGLLSFINKIAGSQGSPILLFLTSLAIVFITLKLVKKGAIQLDQTQDREDKGKLNWDFLLGIATAGFFIYILVDKYKLDNMLSDVIPTIQFQVNQLLNGKYPYEVITTFEYPLPPTYLPMMWLPYVIPTVTNIDIRVFAFILFVICLIPYLLFIKKRVNFGKYEASLKAKLPFLFLLIVLFWKTEEIGWSVETMIMGYYALLAIAILNGNKWLIALGLIACLLSRFSLLFWVPYLLIVIWANVSFKRALTIGLTVLAGVLLLYVIPFLSKDWESFSKGMEYYTFAAHTEWSGQAWQNPGDQPHQLSNGVGFATYFYNLLSGDIDSRIAVIKKWHIIMSVLAVVFWGLLHYFKLKQYDYRIIALLGLKFYFVFFYSFIQVPYIYLFFVPTIISFIILTSVSLKSMVAKSTD